MVQFNKKIKLVILTNRCALFVYKFKHVSKTQIPFEFKENYSLSYLIFINNGICLFVVY